MDASTAPPSSGPTIMIVSGGNGASGRQLVDTVLVQYPDLKPIIVMHCNVRRKAQVRELMAQAEAQHALLIHTMVDRKLRKYLTKRCRQRNINVLDLMGPLFEHLTSFSGVEPIEKPGLYGTLNKDYFDRVEAIEFAMVHDDGMKTRDLMQAEIVLVGVSRTGKTPLSMYLAVLGWKVANVALAPGVPPPRELLAVDRRRVFALDIGVDLLVSIRRTRQSRMGVQGQSRYTDEARVFEELEEARALFKKHRFKRIDVSNKAIESSADEILDTMSKRFGL